MVAYVCICLTIAHVSCFWRRIVKDVAIIPAAAIDAMRNKLERRTGVCILADNVDWKRKVHI
jgi:predicted ABC-type sugar transport system permease subunit